jgi:hypothetical protein
MTVAAMFPIVGFAGTLWPDRALSDEAQVLRELVDAASEFSGSVTMGESRRTQQEALTTAYQVAQVDDWDGAGARRVEPSTYMYARQFLRLLPNSVSLPDIAIDTDGEILFEWDSGRRQIFSISIGRDGTLTFAGLFGHTKIHGIDHFREELPLTILDCLGRLDAQPTF